MEEMDVLICAAEIDVERLLDLTIKSIIQNFIPLRCIYIVTNAKQKAIRVVNSIKVLSMPEIIVLEDSDVLLEEEMCLDGWVKQQIIKMRVDMFTKTENICIIGADTILLQRITWDDLVIDNKPIVYFNRDNYPSIHLEYERVRLVYMANLLQTVPKKSYLLGNFIMELMVFNRNYLIGLREYLFSLYGENYFCHIAPLHTKTLIEKLHFSEWALYCIYLLDVKKEPTQVRLSTPRYMAHIHSNNYYKRFRYDSKIVHFVAKDLNLQHIRGEIATKLGG